MEKIKILLVDDHAIVREGLSLVLNAQSDMIVVGEAAEGNEALVKISQLFPDIVIIDLRMPNGREGLPTINEIRQRFPHVKVLVLSMSKDEQSIMRAIKAGASGYLLKSSPSDELISAVRKVFAGQAYLFPDAQKTIIERIFHHNEEESVDSFELLSQREKEILILAAKGYTNKEAGELLNISPRTVENHKTKMMKKLELETRKDLVHYALERGLLNG